MNLLRENTGLAHPAREEVELSTRLDSGCLRDLSVVNVKERLLTEVHSAYSVRDRA